MSACCWADPYSTVVVWETDRLLASTSHQPVTYSCSVPNVTCSCSVPNVTCSCSVPDVTYSCSVPDVACSCSVPDGRSRRHNSIFPDVRFISDRLCVDFSSGHFSARFPRPKPVCICLIPSYLLIYWLTPWSRVLLEKLTGFQLVKKFPTFYGTWRFITAFTNARHLSLSRAASIQFIPPHPTSWRSIAIFSSRLCLGLPCGLFPSGSPTKTLYTHLLFPIRATCPAHLILLDFITRTILGEEYRSLSSSLCSFLHSPVTLSIPGPYLLSTLFSNTLSLRSSRNVSDQV